MMNAFAWFIYSNKVENSLTTGVKSWKVTFEQDGNDLMDHVKFEIDSIYPGMEDFSDKIEIKNSGEMDAYISYSIRYLLFVLWMRYIRVRIIRVMR